MNTFIEHNKICFCIINNKIKNEMKSKTKINYMYSQLKHTKRKDLPQ